jgi:Abnormal spindle-like microcephaly-assoc'd, ASPM-SPD-2-Hydin
MGSVFGRAVVVALGSAAGVAAAKPRPPVLAFTPSPFDYGQVAAGQAASRTFTLANTGGQGTGRLRVTLAGSAAFTITGDTCHSLAPGKTCSVTVRFTPAGSGTVTATLTAAGKKKAVTVADALAGTGKGLGEALGNIYWADSGDGTVNSAALDGSNPQAIVNGQDDPIGVAVNNGHLYWASSFGNTINEAGLDGSNQQTLVSGQGAAGMAVDGSHIYWSIEFSGAGTLGTIWEAGLDGSNRTWSSPGRAIRTGWRSTAATCTGPAPAPVWPGPGRSGRPAWTAAARTPSSPAWVT